jgi:hypothetical protein
VVHAASGHWFVNEKGAVAEADGLPAAPPGFAASVDGVLTGLDPDPATLAAALAAMASLTAAVRARCDPV